jgi:hypothetical protein
MEAGQADGMLSYPVRAQVCDPCWGTERSMSNGTLGHEHLRK